MVKGEKRLTENYYFDTDCLSAFLWTQEESILAKLFPQKIILPYQVYDELKKVPHLLARVDTLKRNGELRVESIEVDSDEYDDYLRMTTSPDDGMRIIGRGEAAGIAMVRHRGGILASNNLRDILPYIQKYSLQHTTSGDIMIEALKAGLITEQQGNTIWANMLARRRMLPAATFSDYLSCKAGEAP